MLLISFIDRRTFVRFARALAARAARRRRLTRPRARAPASRAMSAFEDVGLCPELIACAERAGFVLPTPIQSEAIPLCLTGGDVLASAETGSGKTFAFGAPVLQLVHETIVSERLGASERQSARRANEEALGGACGLSANARSAACAVDGKLGKAQTRSPTAWGGVRGRFGVDPRSSAARVMFEAEVSDDGLARFGFSSRFGALDGLGADAHSYGYGGTGKKSHNKSFADYGETFGKGDVIGCLLDCERRAVTFTKNGRSLGDAFALSEQSAKADGLFPAVCMKNAECIVRFSESEFKFPPPDGYVGFASLRGCDAVDGDDAASSDARDSGTRKPRALILEPARDLAEQTHEFFVNFASEFRDPTIVPGLFIGGVKEGPQHAQLREGVDIVTGTPIRVLELVQNGRLDLSAIRYFVLDEADRLLDTGNQAPILKLFERMPKIAASSAQRLQVMLFSATLHSPEIRELADSLTVNATWVDLKGKDAVPETVHHALVLVDPTTTDVDALEPRAPTDRAHSLAVKLEGEDAVSESIKRLKPHVLRGIIDAHEMDQCLIFCRTNFDCDNLEKFLNECGGGKRFRGADVGGVEGKYSCCVLGGSRNMDERRRNLQAFKNGDVRFLICTDVAARGIDIKNLPYVINMTLPDKSEDYIHRIGRVGRADTMGLAISIVAAKNERVWYCTKKGYKPWFEPKSEDVKLTKEGGHTIWYDEPKLLKDIEKRLGATVTPLGPNYALPEAFGVQSKDAYGKSRDEKPNEETNEHLLAYAPHVRSLAALETKVQSSFWQLKRKFAATS